MDKQYGLALGGGAARGLAYIGIVRYIEENDIKISELSGTSIGSIIAGLYAIGKTSKEMKEIAVDIQYHKLLDSRFKKGLLKGDKIYKKLEDIFGNIHIEDLKIPLTIVATNIETGEKKEFSEGRMIDAIRASISLPGIFEPYKIGENLYVDGCVTNNLPIESLKENNIIAVTTLTKTTDNILLKHTLLGVDFDIGFFGMNFQILQKAFTIMMRQNEFRSLDTIGKNITLIEPIYGDIEAYSFNRVDELIEVGYMAIEKDFKL